MQKKRVKKRSVSRTFPQCISLLVTSALVVLVAGTSHSEEIPAAPPGTFSIVVLPDSQAYTTERGGTSIVTDPNAHEFTLAYKVTTE